MTAATQSQPVETPARGWTLELSVGLIALVLGLGAWLFLQFSDGHSAHDKPHPAWLGVPKVMAQMSDGRMVNVKVNLRLKDEKAVEELDPHLPAFAALIQEVGGQVDHDALQDSKGIQHFGSLIRESLNDYLAQQSVHAKIKDVAFAELMLLP
ncbi:MAG: flagellar basal body-associated FliL family protein [Aquabacterium sp.]